jgi:hypothetical protein
MPTHRDSFAIMSFQQNYLACRSEQSDECPDRGIYRAGRFTNMTTSTIEEKTQTAAGTAPEPKPTAKAKTKKGKPAGATKAKSAKKATKAKKTADTVPQAPAVAPKKAKSGKRATAAEKPATAREGSKTAQILELLKRPGGVTLKGIMAYASHCTSLA